MSKKLVFSLSPLDHKNRMIGIKKKVYKQMVYDLWFFGIPLKTTGRKSDACKFVFPLNSMCKDRGIKYLMDNANSFINLF